MLVRCVPGNDIGYQHWSLLPESREATLPLDYLIWSPGKHGDEGEVRVLQVHTLTPGVTRSDEETGPRMSHVLVPDAVTFSRVYASMRCPDRAAFYILDCLLKPGGQAVAVITSGCEDNYLLVGR